MVARGLGGHLQPGLRALGPHSARVRVARPRQASESVALDDALKPAHPRDPRWDYGIGIKDGAREMVAWVEVHPATSAEVDAVLKKFAWLKRWLDTHEDACAALMSTFHWVATDSGVHIDAARRRRLNAAGLRMPQSQLRL